MPKLEPIVSEAETKEWRTMEREIFQLSSVLAQIEIASCFRNAEEPQFQLLSLIATFNPILRLDCDTHGWSMA